MKDFFISYNSSDRSWAEWIAWQLEEAEYTTVLQAWDFRPGSNFVLAMQRAAAEAERTIAVLSPDYLTALYPQPEWGAAFAQDPTGQHGTLLPVRVRECDLRGLLPQIIYIDLVELDEVTAKEALLVGVRRGRAKPPVAPDFPGTGALAGPRTVPQAPYFPGGPADPLQAAPMARVDQRGPHVPSYYNAAGGLTEAEVRGTPLQNLIMSYLSYAAMRDGLRLSELFAQLQPLGFLRHSVVEEVWKLREKRWIRFRDPLCDDSPITTRIIDLGPP